MFYDQSTLIWGEFLGVTSPYAKVEGEGGGRRRREGGGGGGGRGGERNPPE